jgi:hypothetical protein
MDRTEPAADAPPSNVGMPPLTLFVAKAVIVTVLITGSVLFLSSRLISKAEESFLRVTKIGGSDFWTKFERQLDRAADPSRGLSAEKREMLLVKLRAVSAQWKPFIMEVHSIITDAPTPPNPQKH